MIFAYPRRQGILLLCSALLHLCSCRPSAEKAHQPETGSTGCDSALQDRYSQAKGMDNFSPTTSKAIINFYHAVPAGCRNLIAGEVSKDLFNLVYTFHSSDSLVLPFLKEMASESALSETQQARAWLAISAYYLYARIQTDTAAAYMAEALERWPQMNDTVLKSYHSQMGQYLVLTSRLKAAGDHYLKAINLCERVKDSAGMASNYANYGTVFSKMGDYRKSIRMKQKAVAFFQAQKQYDRLLIGYVGIGVEYGYLHEYDSSMAYYKKAVAITEQGIRNPNVEFDLYISMGGISLGMNRFEAARQYYSKASSIVNLNTDSSRRKMYIMASTPAFAPIRNVEEEIRQIKGYIPSYYAEHNLDDACDAYYTLYHIYYLQKRFDQSLHHYEIYDSLKSVLAREENRKYTAEMETKYQTQKKELQIKVQQKEIRQSNMLNGMLLALLGALGLGTAFILTRIKLKRKKKEAELQQQFTRQLIRNTEEERSRIARDLHDGISQELMLLKRQMSDNQEQTNERIDAIIDEVRLISRDLHPVMLDKIGLKRSLEHICNQMMEHHMLFLSADIEYTGGLDKDGELQLFRMVQEALNNVVKYAGAQAAKVSIQESATFVYTEIIDNGKGFDVAAAIGSKSSFGLLSLTQRARSLGGKTEISSSASGTVVKIEIPKLHV